MCQIKTTMTILCKRDPNQIVSIPTWSIHQQNMRISWWFHVTIVVTIYYMVFIHVWTIYLIVLQTYQPSPWPRSDASFHFYHCTFRNSPGKVVGVAVIGFHTPKCSHGTGIFMYIYLPFQLKAMVNVGKQIQSHGAYHGYICMNFRQLLAIHLHQRRRWGGWSIRFCKGFRHHDDITTLFFLGWILISWIC